MREMEDQLEPKLSSLESVTSEWDNRYYSTDLASVETDDMVKLYLREAVQVPLLTAEQEVELAKRIEAGHKAAQKLQTKKVNDSQIKKLQQQVESGRLAREHMIRANARLVISIAKKYIGRGLPFLDLIQEGNIGLMRAIRNFDYHRGFRFSTYATWWIRQGISRSLAEQSRTIRLPTYLSEQISKMQNEQRRLEQSLNHPPTNDELAEAIGLPPEKIEQMRDMMRQPLSLQTPIGDDEDETLGNFIEDHNAPDPEEETTHALMNADLRLRLEALPERERQILELRYGLNGDESLTLYEIGRRMGITRERARQLENNALNHLRQASVKTSPAQPGRAMQSDSGRIYRRSIP